MNGKNEPNEKKIHCSKWGVSQLRTRAIEKIKEKRQFNSNNIFYIVMKSNACIFIISTQMKLLYIKYNSSPVCVLSLSKFMCG